MTNKALQPKETKNKTPIMKKASIRSVLAMFLIAASIGSYIFLNTISTPSAVQQVVETPSVQVLEDAENQVEKEETFALPDVSIITKVIKASKRFLPAS